MQAVVAAGTGATPAAFYLGLCRLRSSMPLPASTRRCCRRAILHRHDDCAASIPKSGPEIKNQCTNKAVSEENLAAIPKSGPEIKNRCSSLAVLEGFLAAIPKFGLEIKNRCSSLAVLEGFLAAIAKFDP